MQRPITYTTRIAGALAILVLATSSGWSRPFAGNGDTGFGGPIGLGSLTLTDDGTNITGTLTKGPNGFNDALVIYIESGPGGFSSTAGFGDAGDGLRKAISGINGTGNSSVMTFTGGFLPNYAIALGPYDDNFGGLWSLANGGNNSLPFINSVNLSPLGNNAAATYTFSFPVSEIGLTPGLGETIELFGTYVSDTGYRSGEAILGNDTGMVGWNPFTETADVSYTLEATPEASSLVLLGIGGLGILVWLRRSRMV